MAEPYESPYRSLVLQETERVRRLRDQPVPDMFTPDERDVREATQSGNKSMGYLFALSPDKNVHAIGSEMLKEALMAERERVTDHGLLKPLTGEFSMFPEVRRQRELEQAQRSLTAAELKEQTDLAARAGREQQAAIMEPYREAKKALDEATAALRRREAELGKPMTTDQAKNIRQLSTDVDNLAFVEQKFKGFKSPWQGIGFIGEIQDAIARAGKGNEWIPAEWKEQQEIWASLQRIVEMKERHANFGATFTAGEKALWDKVTPPRGSTPEQMKQWIDEQSGLLKKGLTKEMNAAIAAGANPQQVQAMSGGLIQPGVAPVIPVPSPVAPPQAAPSGGGFFYNPATRRMERR